MKSVSIGFNLLVTALHLAATIGTAQQARSQSIIPIADIIPTKYIVEQNILLAQAVAPTKLQTTLDEENITEAVPQIEQTWEKQYEGYFGVNFSDRPMTTKYIADTLDKIATQTGKKPALIYLVPQPQQLEIVLITPESQPIHKRIPEANNKALLAKVTQFRQSITNPNARNPTTYLPAAQQLYQWLIAPIEADLKSNNIDTLVFCMGGGLRTIPLAALHDGKQFLIEKYSLGRIPAFKFTDTLYANIKKSQVLAMGASEFKDQNPLPAVPVELSAIAKDIWHGRSFLNQKFTLNNLQSQRTKQPFKIIHLATHADFKAGSPSNSYVQFWDKKLTLDKMRDLRWNNPPVDLLVLSACRTAIGDKEAELGFAGLAVQSGVKSALASLWYVSDEGTLGLMTEFYRQLKTAPIKAEALRQAQIAMIQGKVRLEDGRLQNSRGNVSLPPALAAIKDKNLSHPYYWAAFTLIGSPW